MPLIGITGGIGTGKSTVTRIFRELGAITFSADEAAREVLAAGSPALQEVAAAFGSDVLHPSGDLDRNALAHIVFADSRARERLESITHPRILEILRRNIDSTRNESPGAVIAVEAPLLFEAKMEDWFDHIVVVVSDEDVQIRRLLESGRLSLDEARARIRAQNPLSEKAARGDFIIHNNGSLEDLRRAAEQTWAEMVHSDSA